MTSRRDLPPTGAELLVRASVADPHTATGELRCTPLVEERTHGFSHFGQRPVLTWLPSGVITTFAYGGNGRLRVAAPGLLAVSDGERAAVQRADRTEVAAALVVFDGPLDLLLPDLEHQTLSEPVRDSLLGRVCWRVEVRDDDDVATWWLDDRTGCALRRRSNQVDLELLSLTLDESVDEALFVVPAGETAAVPEDVWVQTSGTLSHQEEDQEEDDEPVAGFDLRWWPTGCHSWPSEGDPDVPEALFVLPADLLLGVTRAGREVPVRGEVLRRWNTPDLGAAGTSSDGWSFALCWREPEQDEDDDEPWPVAPRPDEADVDRIVASVPGGWL